MMAESVNDVATVQRTLQRTLEATEDELAAQARLTRDLQDDLLRTRMVEFEGLSDRLYRVVRQAAKETGKQVRLDIVGGSIEVDRGVLDRMTGAFEHLLRNCVTHGIEPPEARTRRRQGRRPARSSSRSRHEGNEVGVEFRDDGAGLNLARIRDKGDRAGPARRRRRSTSDAELANLIFTPGFSTADKVTELAGRGVGMDVVRSEVNAMGGRIETATAAGPGHALQAGPAADHRGDAGRDAALRRDHASRCRRRWSRSCAAPTPPRSTPAYASGAYDVRRPRAAVLLARRAAAARRAAGEPARAHAHRSSSSAAPSSASRCTSTKCSATRKWWSRTSARSCRACPAWPA